MNKRLNRSDYMFTLLFILMLAVSVGAFFYGVQIGTQRADDKYAAAQKHEQEQAAPLTAYDQQYLVSFYHTIYSPYREFQKKWLDNMDALALPSSSTDPKLLLKDAKAFSDRQYAEMSRNSMPESSPLLVSAQTDMLKSLKLFAEAADRLASESGGKTGAELADAASQDAYVQQAVQFYLSAQQDYYSAVVQWNKTVEPDLQGLDVMAKPDLSFDEWQTLNLNEKDAFISQIMTNQLIYVSYYPQDLAARVEDMIRSGGAQKLNLSTVNAVVNALVGTDAVRGGDYSQLSGKYFAHETLPLLPFFES